MKQQTAQRISDIVDAAAIGVTSTGIGYLIWDSTHNLWVAIPMGATIGYILVGWFFFFIPQLMGVQQTLMHLIRQLQGQSEQESDEINPNDLQSGQKGKSRRARMGFKG